MNNIGITDKEGGGFEQLAWSTCSDLLERCKYYEFNNINSTRPSELKILSLNIRSLNNKISSIRDELQNYAKFDILCFNETCCSIDCLPFGGNELELEPFYPPIMQSPSRQSNRGVAFPFILTRTFVLIMTTTYCHIRYYWFLLPH